jgi:hypothetical protein
MFAPTFLFFLPLQGLCQRGRPVWHGLCKGDPCVLYHLDTIDKEKPAD